MTNRVACFAISWRIYHRGTHFNRKFREEIFG